MNVVDLLIQTSSTSYAVMEWKLGNWNERNTTAEHATLYKQLYYLGLQVEASATYGHIQSS